ITVFSIFNFVLMFVCVCNAVTDKLVRDCIADGAESREAVTKGCGAGGDCGACHQMIEEMVEDHLIDASKLRRTRAA
ncbi:MAG: (2Fe-2S)-binding protein, partial [Polyangiaceae bacterium]